MQRGHRLRRFGYARCGQQALYPAQKFLGRRIGRGLGRGKCLAMKLGAMLEESRQQGNAETAADVADERRGGGAARELMRWNGA